MRFAKQILLGAGLFVILSLTLTGCGRSVAKVNGEKISRKEYISRLENMPVTVNNQTRTAGVVVMEQMIQERLRMELAKKEGALPTEEQVDNRIERMKRENALQGLKQQGLTDEDIRQQVRLQQAIINLMTKGITIEEKQAKEFYDKNKDQVFTMVESVEFGAIPCRKKEDIEAARVLLKDKKQEFSSVAMRYGDDPNVRRSQGRIGLLPKDLSLLPNDALRPSKTIHDAIFSLKRGEVSDVVRDDDGTYYIFKVYEARGSETKSYAMVKDQIMEALAMQEAEKRYNPQSPDKVKGPSPNDRFREFFKQSKVRVNVRRYSNLWESMKQTASMEEEMMKSQQGPPQAAPSGGAVTP